MPELPEVETVVRGLRPRLEGRSVLRLRLGPGARLGYVQGSLPRFRRTLTGATVVRVSRKAKYILLSLDCKEDARTWVVHLGMTGQLYACRPHAPMLPHTHLVAELSGGDHLRLRDPRRFGRTRLLAGRKLDSFFQRVGPDPFELPAPDFVSLLEGRTAPIKNLLLNQALVSGIGNIYANEALFLARIHPGTPAGVLSALSSRKLHTALRRVLRAAIKGNGTTILDYRTSEGQPGWYQNRLRVYDREGEPCRRCGAAIRRLVLLNRSAHFCPVCQPRQRRKHLRPRRGKGRQTGKTRRNPA